MMPVRRLMHRIEEIDISTGALKGGMGRAMIPDPPPAGKSGNICNFPLRSHKRS
jgi:hypothetical protein